MFAFRVCRIVATLVHRAYFLLLADFFAGILQWYLINFYTGVVDLFFAANCDFIWKLQEPYMAVAGVGFAVTWWMVHYLSTKQMWFNGVVIELFLLVQLLGWLSNLAFTTTNHIYPLLVALSLYFLVDYYRYYIQQLRQQDPEQTFYRISQLKKPFVPQRALQVIQVTPIIYFILFFVKDRFDEVNFFRFKYSLGMADALVFVGINLDFGLAVLTRLVGTLRHVYQNFSWSNVSYLCRLNISGSYSGIVRDLGWKSVPADQLQISWIIFWCSKISLITFLWSRLEHTELTFAQFVAQEVSGNFVVATATVYLGCLVTGFLLSLVGAVFTLTSDVLSCSNSVCQGSYDTVQHIRWMSLPWRLYPDNRVDFIWHALIYAHLPLCGKMIQNVGEVVRRRCQCNDRSWASAVLGILAIAAYMAYSCSVFMTVSIGPTNPYVSDCFAYTVNISSAVWLLYNSLITIAELVTVVVYQGLAEDISRQNLDRGTKIYRNVMAGLLIVSLTVVNVVALTESLTPTAGIPCGYRDIIHNVLQIISRIVFTYLAVKKKKYRDDPHSLCITDSVTLQRSVSQARYISVDQPPCGLCYSQSDMDKLTRLQCGHVFHKTCFKTWRNWGKKCPVCRTTFRMPDVLQAYKRVAEENLDS